MQHQVDTTIPGNPNKSDTSWLSVAVLMSYQHMGTANFVRPCFLCGCKKQQAEYRAQILFYAKHFHGTILGVMLAMLLPENVPGVCSGITL